MDDAMREAREWVMVPRDEAQQLLDNLNARIDGAERSAVPSFPGIVALSDALAGPAQPSQAGLPDREVSAPLFDSFGEDEFSWNIHDREENENSDGTGRPGANMVGNAIAVWAGLRADPPTVADAAAAFNLAPAMIVKAVNSAFWLYLSGDPADPATCLIEAEGE